MKQVVDSKGRTFNIKVNIGTAKRVKDLTGHDILDLTGEDRDNIFSKIKSDPFTLADIITVLIEEDLKALNLTKEAFLESFTGDIIDDFSDALMQEIADFFPSRQSRLIKEQLAEIKKLEDEIYSTPSGEQSGVLPESSE